MRKIIASTHATLDGFIDNPHEWSTQHSDKETESYAITMTMAADALLLGRVTYEGMAQAWPNMSGDAFADHVNAITKYVVASQPVDTDVWSPTVVIPGEDLLARVAELKNQPGGDILIWGNGRLTDALAKAGLLDEYQILIYPVLKGAGEPLFRKESATPVELVGSTTFATGAILLTYQPTR
ncbi:dihydrofolate reductase family protein [Nonomuraea sp. NPDC059194]|uniref:dihydrofolate reductase family protein n=1 Tax=Nonomuraea sp. NPDC059194 TaxID=3346764 RepID=UPI00367AEC53